MAEPLATAQVRRAGEGRAIEPTPSSPAATMPTGPGIARGTPEFRRTVVAMLAAGFTTFALMYCVQPVLPEFVREFGISPATASLSLSLTTGIMGVAMLGVSLLSEAVGRRGLMILSMALAAVLTLASAFLPGWTTFLISRALLGIAFAGLPALSMAYLGEEMEAEALGLAMGLYVGGTAVGGMTGRLLTAWLTDLVSWRFAVGAIGAAGVLAALLFWRMLPPSRRFVPEPGGTRASLAAFTAHLRDGTLLRLFSVGFVVLGAIVALYNYIGFRLMAAPYDLSQAVVGLIFVVYLLGVGASGWAGQLSGRIGRATLLRGSIAVMIVGAAITLIRPLPLIVLGIAIVTAAFFAAHSVASGWVALHTRAGKAQSASLYLCFYYLGSSLAGWAGGLFWEGIGWPGVVVFASALLGLGVVLASQLPRIAPAQVGRG
ncbi:MAG TPA: MFS transporter [Longimicrobiaceae bacterium]|nr:MFS transporter [Longimicrobiaceae bacterium]